MTTRVRRRKGGHVNNFKETSFRPSSIGSDSRGDGRTDERSGGRSFVRSDSQSDVSLSLPLLLLLRRRRRRRPSLDPNLAKKTHLKRGGGGQKSQAALTQDGVNSRVRACVFPFPINASRERKK